MKKLIIALLFGLLCFVLTYKITSFKPKQMVQGNYYSYSCQGTLCHVYLTNSIASEDQYLGLYDLIENSQPGQVIAIHLSGRGGHMATVYHLANSVLQSKAEIDTIVEGPVYSAHAFIAMLGSRVVVLPYSQFLFHLPAVRLTEGGDAILPDLACTEYAGHNDRGQSGVQKCLDLNKGEQALFDHLFKTYMAPFLTPDEILKMYAGHDIIVSGKEMDTRINSRGNP